MTPLVPTILPRFAVWFARDPLLIGVEQPVEVHVQQAARVLGALDAAARPVERLCDPAQHQERSTQVSLLPPP